MRLLTHRTDDGIVRGKASLRRYWVAALAKNLDLRFRVTSVYRGIETIVIAYENRRTIIA